MEEGGEEVAGEIATFPPPLLFPSHQGEGVGIVGGGLILTVGAFSRHISSDVIDLISRISTPSLLSTPPPPPSVLSPPHSPSDHPSPPFLLYFLLLRGVDVMLPGWIQAF